MILYGVRWQEEENKGFMRSEFPKPEQAIAKAKELDSEGKLNVNIKLIDISADKFVGELHFKDEEDSLNQK